MVSPELKKAVQELAAEAGFQAETLGAARLALQRAGVTWSGEGELLFPQDRTALLIELDELIAAQGAQAPVAALIAAGG